MAAYMKLRKKKYLSTNIETMTEVNVLPGQLESYISQSLNLMDGVTSNTKTPANYNT
jgi:hypothetical protein